MRPKTLMASNRSQQPTPLILFSKIFEQEISIFFTFNDIQQLFLFGSKFYAEYRIVPNSKKLLNSAK